MFLPTRIEHPYERVPYVTNALLGLNIVTFALTWGRIEHGLEDVALNTQDFAVHQLVTHMFLHVGVLHLLGNMLFLAVYGRYVEERLGPLRYAGAYLLFGLFGAAFYCASNDGLAVGASGAISGLMGFVLVGAPWAEVRVLFVFYVYVRPFKLAAFWLVGLWICFQLLHASTAPPWSRIAYSAHFGGFLAGCGLAALLRSSICEGTGWWLDPAPPGGGSEAVRRLRHSRGVRRPSPRGAKDGSSGIAVAFDSLGEMPSQVAVIKLLMRRLDLEPEAARKRLDMVRDGQPQHFVFLDVPAAESFREEACALGVQARLAEGNSSPVPREA